jgi:hypothetical protein
MKAWIRIPGEKAHSFYAVPLDVATAEGNAFFGLEHHPLDIDGPWPFLAFLKDATHPNVITICIFSILPEYLESEGFNPLTETGSHLSLDSQTLVSLVDLLQNYAARLLSTESSQKAFKTLEAKTIADFRLHPERFPGTEQHYYLQAYDPLGEAKKNQTVTVLTLTTERISDPRDAFRLSLKIASFPLQKLQDPSFKPLEHALPQVRLDRNGLQELASLLQERRDHFVG